MDTDNLSNEAYQGIFNVAEQFNHDLTLQFGVLASSCKNEADYLDNALQLIAKIRTLDNAELSDLFFGNLPAANYLHLMLDQIVENINHIKKTPESQRHYEF